MSTTLIELREQCLQRSDMVNSQFVTTAELDFYINNSATELYDILLASYGNDYFMADGYTFNLISGQETYNLPNNFYKMAGIEILVGDKAYALDRFNFGERNYYRNSPYVAIYGTPSYRYRLFGNKIMFVPKPTGAYQMVLYYAPKMPVLTTGVNIDLSIIDGWTEYIVIDVAIKLLTKSGRLEELQPYVGQKMEIKQRLTEMKEYRDWGTADRVTDVTQRNRFWPFGFGR